MTEADKFVITRRRKKYKFAKFDESPNCFQFEEWEKSGVIASVAKQSRIIVEIGAGSALFSVELARRHPENFYVAVDIKSDRLYRGARTATADKIDNIMFVRSDIWRIAELFPVGSVDEIWLTFSDPYPRRSDARHRLTAPRFLELYQQILKSDGILHFKTDNQPLFDWSVEQLTDNGWKINVITRDLHNSNLPIEPKIMTTYEQQFTAQGLSIYYFDAEKP